MRSSFGLLCTQLALVSGTAHIRSLVTRAFQTDRVLKPSERLLSLMAMPVLNAESLCCELFGSKPLSELPLIPPHFVHLIAALDLSIIQPLLCPSEGLLASYFQAFLEFLEDGKKMSEADLAETLPYAWSHAHTSLRALPALAFVLESRTRKSHESEIPGLFRKALEIGACVQVGRISASLLLHCLSHATSLRAALTSEWDFDEFTAFRVVVDSLESRLFNVLLLDLFRKSESARIAHNGALGLLIDPLIETGLTLRSLRMRSDSGEFLELQQFEQAVAAVEVFNTSAQAEFVARFRLQTAVVIGTYEGFQEDLAAFRTSENPEHTRRSSMRLLHVELQELSRKFPAENTEPVRLAAAKFLDSSSLSSFVNFKISLAALGPAALTGILLEGGLHEAFRSRMGQVLKTSELVCQRLSEILNMLRNAQPGKLAPVKQVVMDIQATHKNSPSLEQLAQSYLDGATVLAESPIGFAQKFLGMFGNMLSKGWDERSQVVLSLFLREGLDSVSLTEGPAIATANAVYVHVGKRLEFAIQTLDIRRLGLMNPNFRLRISKVRAEEFKFIAVFRQAQHHIASALQCRFMSWTADTAGEAVLQTERFKAHLLEAASTLQLTQLQIVESAKRTGSAVLDLLATELGNLVVQFGNVLGVDSILHELPPVNISEDYLRTLDELYKDISFKDSPTGVEESKVSLPSWFFAPVTPVIDVGHTLLIQKFAKHSGLEGDWDSAGRDFSDSANEVLEQLGRTSRTAMFFPNRDSRLEEAGNSKKRQRGIEPDFTKVLLKSLGKDLVSVKNYVLSFRSLTLAFGSLTLQKTEVDEIVTKLNLILQELEELPHEFSHVHTFAHKLSNLSISDSPFFRPILASVVRQYSDFVMRSLPFMGQVPRR